MAAMAAQDSVVDEVVGVLLSTAFPTMLDALGPGWTAVLLEACCVRAADQRAYLPDRGAKPLRLRAKDLPETADMRAEFGDATYTLMAHAARRGSTSLVSWMRARGARFQSGETHNSRGAPRGTIYFAAMGGLWDLVALLSGTYGQPPVQAVYGAARGGHLGMLQRFQAEGTPAFPSVTDRRLCLEASQGGHLGVLQWAHESGFEWDAATCAGAAMGGYLDVLKYAHENGCPWDGGTCFMAALSGHLDVLKYAHENGCPWDSFTCQNAASQGHLDVLKYAHENGCPWNEWTCKHAAEGGHLDVLQYAHENGCPWAGGTCSIAAKGGHLDVLKYAHENGCPWDKLTCSGAARGGHLAVLKYAHENGCWWNKQTCSNAALGGHLDVVKYARMNGCPWNKAECRRLAACPSRTHQHVVAWIDSLPQD